VIRAEFAGLGRYGLNQSKVGLKALKKQGERGDAQGTRDGDVTDNRIEKIRTLRGKKIWLVEDSTRGIKKTKLL